MGRSAVPRTLPRGRIRFFCFYFCFLFLVGGGGKTRKRRTSWITDLGQQAAGALVLVLFVGALRVRGDVFGLLVV